MFKKFLIFPFILVLALAFSYAQFNESLYIGGSQFPNTVSTGELDVGIWAWTGKPYYSPYMEIEPLAKIWGYDNATKTVEFKVNNAYPGAKTFCIVWIRNTGSIAAKVKSIKWNLPDYVNVTYYGGKLPDWVAKDARDFVDELYKKGMINNYYYNEMINTINERVNSTGCLHEGLVLDAEENDALILYWTFEDNTPENASFTGSCTIEFTQFNQ